MLCFRKFPVARKFMDKRRWEYQDFPSNFFFSQSRKNQQGNPSVLCFRKFPVAKMFIDRKEGEVSRFSFHFFFVSQCRKMPQGFPLVFQYFRLWRKFGREGEVGEYQDFPLKVSCLTVPESFVGRHFRVSLISGIEIFYAPVGCVTIFCPEIFVSQYRNISQGNPSVLCFRKLLVAKFFMDKKGGISRVSVENFLSDSAETHFVAEPYCAVFQRISSSEKVYGKEGVGVSSFSVNVFLPDSAGSDKLPAAINLCIGGGGMAQGVSDLLSKIFCLTVPKKVVREAFYAVFQKLFGSQKVYG